MALDHAKARSLIGGILKDVATDSGAARTDDFSGLRAVDAKIREARMVLREAGVQSLLEAMDTA